MNDASITVRVDRQTIHRDTGTGQAAGRAHVVTATSQNDWRNLGVGSQTQRGKMGNHCLKGTALENMLENRTMVQHVTESVCLACQ